MTSTLLILFDKIHVKQVIRPLTTSQVGDYNILFTRAGDGKLDVERGVYDTNNQPKKATFKYKQEGVFCLGVAKVESKEYETITGKRSPVFDYAGNKIVTIGSYKK